METVNGYFKIENNVAEALALINLSEYETRLLWVILRKTWGWNKEKDHISFSQFEKATGIKRSNAHPALLRLVNKNIIKTCKEGRIKTYSVNKKTNTWKYEKNKNVIATNNMSTQNSNSISTNNKPLSQDITIPLFEEINTTEQIKTIKQKTNNISNKSLPAKGKPKEQSSIQKLVDYYKKLYKEKFNQEPTISEFSLIKWRGKLNKKLEQGFTLREIAILLQLFAKSKDSDVNKLGFDLGTFFSDTIFNKMRVIRDQSSNSHLENKYGKY